MKAKLVNVRLDAERVRKAAWLRRRGIPLSRILREAIDARYEEAAASQGPPDVQAILARLDAEYPLAASDLPPLDVDVHDRRDAAAAIRARLRKRHESEEG